jgi:uncharacterized protein YjbI with pentapeptide repeats
MLTIKFIANLQGTDFTNAIMTDAILIETDMTEAIGLSK